MRACRLAEVLAGLLDCEWRAGVPACAQTKAASTHAIAHTDPVLGRHFEHTWRHVRASCFGVGDLLDLLIDLCSCFSSSKLVWVGFTLDLVSLFRSCWWAAVSYYPFVIITCISWLPPSLFILSGSICIRVCSWFFWLHAGFPGGLISGVRARSCQSVWNSQIGPRSGSEPEWERQDASTTTPAFHDGNSHL